MQLLSQANDFAVAPCSDPTIPHDCHTPRSQPSGPDLTVEVHHMVCRNSSSQRHPFGIVTDKLEQYVLRFPTEIKWGCSGSSLLAERAEMAGCPYSQGPFFFHELAHRMIARDPVIPAMETTTYRPQTFEHGNYAIPILLAVPPLGKGWPYFVPVIRKVVQGDYMTLVGLESPHTVNADPSLSPVPIPEVKMGYSATYDARA